jgi:hypothetical protein
MTLNGRLRAFQRCCAPLAMMAIFVGACTASNPSAGSSSGNPATASASASTSTPVTAGTLVTTPDGYQFWLSVTKPITTSPDLKVLPSPDPIVCGKSMYLTCYEFPTAPPGKDYIYAVLTVTNKTDRAEPLSASWGALLLMPFGERTQFGVSACPVAAGICGGLEYGCDVNGTRDPFATPDPSMFCTVGGSAGPGDSYTYGTGYAQSLCHPTNPYDLHLDQCELGPGQSTDVYIFWGNPIPASAPIGDVRVYFFGGSGYDQWTSTRIG